MVANYSDGTTDSSKIMKYKVDNVYPRNLKIDGMTNCRDMGGGRELASGGHIKQGMIYRQRIYAYLTENRQPHPNHVSVLVCRLHGLLRCIF